MREPTMLELKLMRQRIAKERRERAEHYDSLTAVLPTGANKIGEGCYRTPMLRPST